MGTINNAFSVAFATALLCAACATSPEVLERRQAVEADIDEILRY